MKKLMLFSLSIILLLGCDSESRPIQENRTPVPNESFVQPERTFTFESDTVGKTPSSWSNNFTGKGGLGNWEIYRDNGNKVLAQLSQEYNGYHFNVIVWDEATYQDLEISVNFKALKGREDQGGGPIWRYQDADNYYIARANPLENNFRVYKVIEGRRKQLANAKIPIETEEWYSITITMRGNHIECFFNSKKYLEVMDATFKNGGKIGLWTKADAVTCFDNLQIGKIE